MPAPEGTAQKKIVKISRHGEVRDRDDERPRKTDAAVVRMGKGNAGRTLDGQTWDAYPEGVT